MLQEPYHPATAAVVDAPSCRSVALASETPLNDLLAERAAGPASRVSRRTLWLVVAAVVVTAAVLLLGWWGGQRLLAGTHERRLAAAGQPVTVADLRNFYRPPDGEDPTADWLAAAAALLADGYGHGVEKRFRILFEPAAQTDPLGPDWPHVEVAAAWLRTQRSCLDLVDRAAAIGGPARFPVDFTQSANMPAPHAGRVASLAGVLTYAAAVHAHHGNGDAAAAAVLRQLAVADALAAEPLAGSQGARHRVFAQAMRTLDGVLRLAPVPADQLARLRRQLAATDFRPDFVRALAGERVMAVDRTGLDAKVRRGQPGIGAFAGMAGRRIDQPRQVLAVYALHEHLEPLVDLPGAEAVAAARRLQAEHAADSVERTLPMIAHTLRWTFRCEALRRTMLVRLAARQYRHARGAWPASPDDLAPQFLDAVPTDPYTDEPLGYRVEGDALLVYSVFENGSDDGGDLAFDAFELPADLGWRAEPPKLP